jgi:hypothetical protein
MDVTPDNVALALAAIVARGSMRPKPDPNKKWPYQLVPFADLRPGTRSPYLVHGVIPLSGLVAVWGPPKCGKSFWAFDLTMHIAAGWSYRGRRVRQGPVVYLAFEGGEGFKARAEAYRRRREIDEKVPFYLLPSSAKLVRDHKALIESVDGQLCDLPPIAVVLDTLNRSIDGSESKDVDMGAYLAAADCIVEAFDCVVIIVHHCGVDANRMRGHTSLAGAVDAELSVKRDAARNIIVQVEAMKDGAEGATFTSSFELVEVGTDEHGQPMTSCVIVPVEGAAADKKAQKLPPSAEAALRALHECLADVGESAPASDHIPHGVTCVTLDQWREYLFKLAIINREGSYREQFRRLRVTLKNAGAIGIWDEQVWAVRASHRND